MADHTGQQQNEIISEEHQHNLRAKRVILLDDSGAQAGVSANPIPISNAYLTNQVGTWGYNAGTSGTLVLSGGKRVLQITAIALGAAGSISINGGDSITIPYDATDKASSAITLEPKGNLTNPTIVFTGTDGYVVEYTT